MATVLNLQWAEIAPKTDYDCEISLAQDLNNASFKIKENVDILFILNQYFL